MENLSLLLFLCFFSRFVSICRSLLAIKCKDDEEGVEEDGSMFHVSFSFFLFFSTRVPNTYKDFFHLSD